ncbi:HAMP domain-containing histidine kinase [Cytobacillus suaedae]|nr:HAMP domain-containing histidine kinase [Cytobacillus suaedae]
MFRKTRHRLAFTNASILFVILILFSSALYLFTEQRIYSQIDSKMITEAKPYLLDERRLLYINQHYNNRSNLTKIAQTPTLYLLWDGNRNIAFQYPLTVFENDELLFLSSTLSSSQGETVEIQNNSFRIINFVERYENGEERKILQAIRNIDQEIGMLNDLRIIILVGIGVGMVVAVITAFYLAQRALKPIQVSWDKQQQFVADASHELRTPLAAIQANTELLLHQPHQTIESESKTIANVLKETKRLNKLIDHLLTLARSDTNQLQLQKVELQLDKVLQTVIEQFSILCEIKGVMFEATVENDLKMDGDEERIKQLLYIILDNALKYTPEKGVVSLDALGNGRQVTIVVKDSGIGIKDEDLPYIFNRFYRGDKSRTGNGAGLGLSIARWIVEAHSGKIAIQSQQGKGTEVKLTF